MGFSPKLLEVGWFHQSSHALTSDESASRRMSQMSGHKNRNELVPDAIFIRSDEMVQI